MQDLTQPAPNSDYPINPFGDDVFSLQSPVPGTPQIHQAEADRCVKAIEKMVGKAANSTHPRAHGELISISSPLAGYGKTHLISRVANTVLKSVSTVELTLGLKASWRDILASTLQNLDGGDSHSRVDTSKLDEAGAYFLANLIGTAVARGIIEERDCPTPLTTLQNDPCKAFAEGFRSKLLVWMKKKAPALRSVKLSSIEFPGFSREDVSFWTTYFLNHFRRDVSGFNSLGELTELEARERVLQLLKIASNCQPMLIVADHLDYCHGSDTAGMEIATVLTAIVENVANCVLIISVNNDLWDSVFKDKLPSALLDRLSGETVELAPVDFDEAKELVVNRLSANGVNYQQSRLFATALAQDCNWENISPLFPRKVIRQAKAVWKQRGKEFYQSVQEEVVAQSESTESTPVAEEMSVPDRTVSPLYTEPKAASEQTPNPFIGGAAMVYPDRPSASPGPYPADSVINRNPFTDPAPADLAAKESPLMGEAKLNAIPSPPPAVDYTPAQPAAKSNGEPTPFANGKPVNGHAPVGKPENVAQIPAEEVAVQKDPMEMYFDQLIEHFQKRSDKLEIDFPGMEMFIKTVGEKHPPLSQSEVTIPGGQGISLRWDLKNYIVWTGFEPARNIYYYNNVLQKLLSDPTATPGKIVCFTHSSSPYNHDLITNNGITADHLKTYFDFIELSNSELVLIQAASKFLRETTEKGYQEEGLKFVLKQLNPLWQRLSQPIGTSK